MIKLIICILQLTMFCVSEHLHFTHWNPNSPVGKRAGHHTGVTGEASHEVWAKQTIPITLFQTPTQFFPLVPL